MEIVKNKILTTLAKKFEKKAPVIRESGINTADINKIVIKGTPLHSSMNPNEEYWITGKADLLPKAKNMPIGKHKINEKAEIINVNDSPPQVPVWINFNPKIPPDINLIPIKG